MVVRLVALALLAAIVAWLVDLELVWSSLSSIAPSIVALGFGLGLLRTFLLSVRWRILDAAGIAEREAELGHPLTRLSQWQYVRYRLANSTFNLFLPTAVGADVARAALVAAEIEDDRTRRVLVILFDRVIGILSIGILGLIAGSMAPNLAYAESYLAAIGILNAALITLLLVGFSASCRRIATRWCTALGTFGQRLCRTIDALAECFDTFRRHKAQVALAILVCFAVHTTSFTLVYIAAQALEIDLSFATLAIITTISWIILLVPITIGGLGVREVSFVMLLAPQGVSEADATALSLFQFAVIAMVGVAGIPVTVLGRSSTSS